MDNGFRKFKRKIRLSAILRALLMGVSLGIIAVAAQWLLAKLTFADPDFIRYGLIGGGIALVAFVIFVVFMLPTDKRLAKRLDDKLQLHEKVQTMIAFRKDDSEMAQLQRETTQQLLMQTPTKKARSKTAWLSMILPVIAVACMVVTIVVPAQANPSVNPEENAGWFLSVYDEQKMQALIEYVQTSGMQDEPKQGIVAELQDLLAELKVIKKKVVMQETVLKSIEQIHKIAKPCHTHTKVITALENSLNEQVKKMGNRIGTLQHSNVTSYMKELLTVLNVDNRAEAATKLSESLTKALEASGDTEENPLYKAFADFAAALAAVTAETSERELQEMLKTHEDALVKAVKQPGTDVEVEKYTINRLLSIFGIPSTELPSDILNSFGDGDISGKPSDPNENDSDKPTGQGGAGDGAMKYGANDDIYDPALDTQVPYGEVIQQYQQIIYDLILDGNISPELEEMLTDYLAILYRPINQG